MRSDARTWLYQQPLDIYRSITFFRKRLNIHAVFGAQDEPGLPAFRLAVDFITRGEIDMEPFVTHRLPIHQIQEAFDLAESRADGALKVSLTF